MRNFTSFRRLFFSDAKDRERSRRTPLCIYKSAEAGSVAASQAGMAFA